MIDPILAVLAAGLGTLFVRALESVTSRSITKSVTTERDRLQSEILGPDLNHQAGNGHGRIDGPTALAESESERFAKLLIEYYAHGLAQAKRSSVASLVSSGVGLAVLVGGVSMALIGSTTAAVIVSLSGVTTNAVGVLFHRQADKALRHMESQTLNLRSDMRSEREAAQAIELMDNVDDPRLRDQLRTAVILRLANAELPQIFLAMTKTVDASRPGKKKLSNPAVNGQANSPVAPVQQDVHSDGAGSAAGLTALGIADDTKQSLDARRTADRSR